MIPYLDLTFLISLHLIQTTVKLHLKTKNYKRLLFQICLLCILVENRKIKTCLQDQVQRYLIVSAQ